MKLSKEQVQLLKTLKTDYVKGLPKPSDTVTDETEYNIIPPPLNCPQWACIILPCLNHLPSMKLFKLIRPTEAEVRKDSKWVIYDAISITKGDIIRISDGDIVPADVVVLSLGMDFVDVPPSEDDEEKGLEDNDKQDTEQPSDEGLFVGDVVVDSSSVNGFTKPQTITVANVSAIENNTTLYAGSMLLQGSCIAVVTKTGPETLLGTLIKKGKWPPKAEMVMDSKGDITSSVV